MQKTTFSITGNNLTVENSIQIAISNRKISLSKSYEKKVKASRKLVEKWICNDEIIYGITTGFGEFKDVKIPGKDLHDLQRNLILSHAAGVG